MTGLVGLFLPFSHTFSLIYAVGGCLIFSGYIVYDTYLINARLSPDEYIMGAISLYLDFVNLCKPSHCPQPHRELIIFSSPQHPPSAQRAAGSLNLDRLEEVQKAEYRFRSGTPCESLLQLQWLYLLLYSTSGVEL